MPSTPPNVLLIQADQLKPQVLPGYGGTADTPHIDALCDSGVLFQNAYCNFPLCAPSRFSMLSGMLPSNIGAYDNAAEYFSQIPTIAHYLTLAGYRTCLSGKQHFVGPDMLHGFHERLVPELYPTNFSWTPSWSETRMESNNDSSGITKAGICARSVQIAHDEAVIYNATEKLHEYAQDRAQPFFLVASFTHPHEPYYCLQRNWDRYKHDDIMMPATPLQPSELRTAHTQRILKHHALLDGDISEAHVRTARHGYLANVSYFDDMVGQLLDTLQLTRLADNTVIIVTADHGDMLGEHGLWFKKHFFDHCARVPLVINAPNRFAAKQCSDSVSLLDLLPSLCEIAGIDVAEHAPEPLDGESLLPFCAGETATKHGPVFGEITSESVPAPMFMVRDGDYKLIIGGGVEPVLYDLADDPQERQNVAEDDHLIETRKRLEQLVKARWDVDALDAAIRTSQRRRRLVEAAHRAGPRPLWEYRREDAQVPWLLRGEGLYNDWAWQGID